MIDRREFLEYVTAAIPAAGILAMSNAESRPEQDRRATAELASNTYPGEVYDVTVEHIREWDEMMDNISDLPTARPNIEVSWHTSGMRDPFGHPIPGEPEFKFNDGVVSVRGRCDNEFASAFYEHAETAVNNQGRAVRVDYEHLAEVRSRLLDTIHQSRVSS